MNSKTYSKALTIIAGLLTVSGVAFLTACGGSSSTTTTTTTIAVTPVSGTTPQSATVNAAFATALAVTVTSNGSPASGVAVTFTAPSSGASGVFGNSTATETDTTDSTGTATISSTFTANGTPGSYTVTATTTGAATPASFALTNTSASAAAIAASSGGNQGATVSTAFTSPLAVLVTDVGGDPVSGAIVTFTVTAGSSGAGGSFPSSSVTDTETTGPNGIATTSQALTANGTPGSFTVSADFANDTSGAPAVFTLINTAVGVTSANYVYYLSGEETINGGGNFYTVAGAVLVDSVGDVIAGEQDYNDGYGLTSPGEPNTPDTIGATGGALVVDPTTGIGTLTLTSSNTSVGVNGVEIFAVQFVNANHALITQFDGTATSSGSLDLQTATTESGNFAFAITGINSNYDSVAFGGVFTAASGSVSGTMDVNDADGGVVTGTPFTATTGTTDGFGRTVVIGITNPSSGDALTFVSYIVGPEAQRIIDVDTTYSAVGSAFGQGSGAFTNASLGSSVFDLLGQWVPVYATLGQFATDGNGNITAGIADDNELDNGLQQEGVSIAGSTYDLMSSGINGYGTMTMTGTGDIVGLGVYMTDPTLNLNDPNNTTTDVGGALVIDLDSSLSGGIGVVTPQTDTTSTDFAGNYAAGFQNFNNFGTSTCLFADCELDMVGPFTMASGGLLSTASIGADDSDPFGTISGVESTGDIYSATPLPVSPGYFSLSGANELTATIDGESGGFDADAYQASATMLYWLEIDSNGVFLGPIEAQGSFTGAPFSKKPVAKQHNQPKAQTIKTWGGVQVK